MFDFLSNPLVDFIISTVISILSIFIGIWLSFRQPIRLPISYETLAVQSLEDSEDELTKKLTQKFPEETIKRWYFIIFRIWNSGRASIELPESTKPLTVAFKKDITVLDYKKIETIPDQLEFTAKLDAEKVLLNFDLLDPKESITLRILVSHNVNYFPAIYARVPGRKRIVRANNIQHATETRNFGIFGICTAIYGYLFSHFGLSPHNPVAPFLFSGYPILFFGGGLTFFLMSWVDRKMPPHSHIPPLTLFFMLFLCFLPIAVVLGSLATIIYILFGTRVSILVYILCLFLLTPLGLWKICYGAVTKLLQKRQKKYNSILVCILTSIVPLAMLVWFLFFYFSAFLLL